LGVQHQSTPASGEKLLLLLLQQQLLAQLPPQLVLQPASMHNCSCNCALLPLFADEYMQLPGQKAAFVCEKLRSYAALITKSESPFLFSALYALATSKW